MDQPDPTTPNKSPAPSVRHYAMFPSGGGGQRSFRFPSYPTPSPTGSKRDGRKPGAPGGGGGGGPDDSDSEDSDDKFARKLRKFMKSSRDHDASDERSKVKEADTIKVQHFQHPKVTVIGGSRHERPLLPHPRNPMKHSGG